MELFIIYLCYFANYFLLLFFIVHYFCRVRGDLPKFERKKSVNIDKPFLFQIFVQLPCQAIYDMLHSDPNSFCERGVIIFEGEQGSGKSMSMMHYATKLKLKYALCKILSNTDFLYSDVPLKHWKQLINFVNGIYGVVVIIDEMQNWFSCKDSKNFPPEMLSVVTQNRKNRRIILGTAQNFYMLSKDIRTQCTEIRKCYTLFGCFGIVVRKKPICDSDGSVKEYRFKGVYTYVQTKALRDSYDTYSVIQRLSDSGFVDKITVQQ